jgi:tungstate transport system substrate-binding protein
LIKRDLDLEVQLVVVGTGQALKLGRSGDVDALLVHSRQAELEFVAAGYASYRREIMYNDFVIVGPTRDQSNVAEAESAADAFARIVNSEAIFVSRGDDSGTHRRELELWKLAQIADLDTIWYRELGSGMGATLNTASALGAYSLTDRASWLNFGNKGDLKLLYAGDPALFNQYTFMPLSTTRHPHVKAELAKELENWLTSETGQNAIAAYTLDGEQLFTPNAE